MFSFGSKFNPAALLGNRATSPAASPSVTPPVGQPRKNSKGAATALELLKCSTSGKSIQSIGSNEKARSPAHKKSVVLLNGVIIQNGVNEKRDSIQRESTKNREAKEAAAAALKADVNLLDQVCFAFTRFKEFGK